MITLRQAIEFIQKTNGKVFTVWFIKRSDGKERVMNVRLDVKKHLKGGERAYNFENRGLVPIYEMATGQYKCFPLDGLTHISIKGVKTEVIQQRR